MKETNETAGQGQLGVLEWRFYPCCALINDVAFLAYFSTSNEQALPWVDPANHRQWGQVSQWPMLVKMLRFHHLNLLTWPCLFKSHFVKKVYVKLIFFFLFCDKILSNALTTHNKAIPNYQTTKLARNHSSNFILVSGYCIHNRH